MARYLITDGGTVLDVVTAKSIREAIESMDIEGEGEFVVYTVTSQRTAKFEMVEETRLTIGSEIATEEDEDSDEDEDENGDKDE